MGELEAPSLRAASPRNRRRTMVCLLVLTLAVGSTACKQVVPGTLCDPLDPDLGFDRTHVLECSTPYYGPTTWNPITFNEEELTPRQFIELLRTAGETPTVVGRVAVVGDLDDPKTSVRTDATNPEPWTVDVTIGPLAGPVGGLPCNVIDTPKVEGFVGGDGTVLATVRWNERVGLFKFSYCEEPHIATVRVTDVNGAEVSTLQGPIS